MEYVSMVCCTSACVIGVLQSSVSSCIASCDSRSVVNSR